MNPIKFGSFLLTRLGIKTRTWKRQTQHRTRTRIRSRQSNSLELELELQKSTKTRTTQTDDLELVTFVWKEKGVSNVSMED